jgi:signal transduction histidine kinase
MASLLRSCLVPLHEEVDRPLSRAVAVTSFILAYVLAVRDVLPPVVFRDYEWWWISLSAVTLSWGVINAAFWRTMSMRVMRAWWLIVPIIGGVRMLTIGWGVTLPPDEEFLIESWIGGSTYIIYLIFWLRPVALMTVVVASAFLPVLSLFWATGAVPTAVWAMIPVYASYILLATLFLTVRAVLIRLHAVAAETRRQQRVTAEAVAEANSRAHFMRLVHDEVLASLTAAIHTEGPPSATVRRQAAEALTTLEPGVPRDRALSETCDQVRLRLLHLVDEMQAEFQVSIDTLQGQVPTVVVDTLLAATREAMRNSVRHAGPQVARILHARITPDEMRIEVSDDGPGFEFSNVPADRMGVRHSIVATVAKLDGGRAHIDTSDGTRVVLQWKR